MPRDDDRDQLRKLLGFTSAYALPEMVGRKELLENVRKVIFEDNYQVVFLFGEGGIGKSRLLARLIEDWNPRTNSNNSDNGGSDSAKQAYVADALVDFYQTNVHLPHGLADSLYQATKDFLSDETFDELREQLVDSWIGRVGGEAEALRERQLQVFEELIEKTNEEGRLLIFFLDTVEQIVYQWPGELQESLPALAESWEWLLALVNKYDNLRLVVAGRPGPNRAVEKTLLAETKQLLDVSNRPRVMDFTVGHLNEAEMSAYFQAVKTALAKEKDAGDAHRLLQKLNMLETEHTDRLKESLRNTGGIPIRLALLIDHFAAGADDSGVFQTSDDPDFWRNRFIGRLLNSPFLADILEVMWRLPKGVNAQLLAAVKEGCEAEGQKILDEVGRYSFIKKIEIPHIGPRYFLHDEIYYLLDEFYSSPEGEKQKIYGKNLLHAAQEYYDKHLHEIARQIMGIYDPLISGDKDRLEKEDREELIELLWQRHIFQVEVVYYTLRLDRNRGERRRYRYTRDADLSGDIGLDYALEAELLAYWSQVWSRRQPGYQEELGHDFEKRMEGVLAMRPIVREWVKGNYQGAIDRAKATKDEFGYGLFLDGTLNAAILSVWQAYASTYAGKPFDETKRLLDDAIRWSKILVDSQDEGKRWRARAILAFAYRVRGYFWDTHEQAERAVKNYKLAYRWWRDVNLRSEEAGTLNDWGYDLARIGKIPQGRVRVSESLRERRALGSLGTMGLSINTLALIQILSGGSSYEGAAKDAERALNLFRSVNHHRGIGLASLAASEAKRRRLENRIGGSASLLRILEEEIAHHADEAILELEISRDIPYLIKAQIERGCVWRDMVKFCTPSSNQGNACSPGKIEEFKGKSQELLDEARKAARTHDNLALEVEALVNRAWLGYYARDEELTQHSIAGVKELLGADFYVGDDPHIRQANKERKELWEQLGKMYLVRGAWQYLKYLEDKNTGVDATDSPLEEMGCLYTLALEFSKRRGNAYANLTRAHSFLYKQLLSLDRRSFERFLSGVSKGLDVLGRYDADNSAMCEFLRDWDILGENDELCAEKGG